jgi:hypothetical protein
VFKALAVRGDRRIASAKPIQLDSNHGSRQRILCAFELREIIMG